MTWLHASDGVRLRAAVWNGGEKGLVVLLTGRSEHLEKYGHVVARLSALGYSVAGVDWRGQGLSDRRFAARNIGHIRDFQLYQRDLEALLAHPGVAAFGARRVFLGHSTGGLVGLRALRRGLSVRGAIFSGPLWDLDFPGPTGPLMRTLLRLAPFLGLGWLFMPTADGTPYSVRQHFNGNALMGNPERYDWFRNQLLTYPQLGLGGPSLGWLSAVLREARALRPPPAPLVPILTFLGSEETIVSPRAIRAYSAHQPNARLVEMDGAQHEVLMETPEIQAQVWAEIETFLRKHLPAA
ncbi:alpha/beta hydrolase [Oceanibium sediminis]|uniref:alpha/beta hydrolase n=1 Tax=Oceanibium sediminis TaxID=2026339 RepID=UPI001300A6E3|nr:alpha/beta hydrolase [Oceanibium sediminis]